MITATYTEGRLRRHDGRGHRTASTTSFASSAESGRAKWLASASAVMCPGAGQVVSRMDLAAMAQGRARTGARDASAT